MFSGSGQPLTADRGSGRSNNPVIQLVGFRLDNEDYAIAITKIQEIILMKPITRHSPGAGLHRGADQPARLGDPDREPEEAVWPAARELDDETRTIVVNIHDKTVGCVVDAVTQVMRINRDQIQPPPLGVLAVNHHYLAGLAKLDDRLLIILDIDKLFEAEELATPAASPPMVST